MCRCSMLIGPSPTYSASAVVRVGIDVIVHSYHATYMRIVHARLRRLCNQQPFKENCGLQMIRWHRHTFSRDDKSSDATLSKWTLFLGHVLGIRRRWRGRISHRFQPSGNLWIAVHHEATVAHFTRPVLTSWQRRNRSACGAGLASWKIPHVPVGDGAERRSRERLRRTATTKAT